MTYVTNYADNTVSVIDGVSGTVKGTIPVGSRPQSVAVDPTRNRVYVGNMQGNNISVIDASRMKVSQTLPAGSHPYAVATDPETGAVYAGNMLDPENWKPLSTPPSSPRKRQNSHPLARSTLKFLRRCPAIRSYLTNVSHE